MKQQSKIKWRPNPYIVEPRKNKKIDEEMRNAIFDTLFGEGNWVLKHEEVKEEEDDSV